MLWCGSAVNKVSTFAGAAARLDLNLFKSNAPGLAIELAASAGSICSRVACDVVDGRRDGRAAPGLWASMTCSKSWLLISGGLEAPRKSSSDPAARLAPPEAAGRGILGFMVHLLLRVGRFAWLVA